MFGMGEAGFEPANPGSGVAACCLGVPTPPSLPFGKRGVSVEGAGLAPDRAKRSSTRGLVKPQTITESVTLHPFA